VGAATIIWFGIKPSYEDTILEERLSLISEYQKQRIRESELLLFFWLKTTTELQNYGINQRSSLQTRFETYSSLFPEFLGFRITSLQDNQSVELKKDEIQSIPYSSDLQRSRIIISESQNLSAGWYDDLKYFFLSQDYTHSGLTYRITTLFDSRKLTDVMLQNVIREDAFTVVWLPDSTTIGRNLPDNLAPRTNPATSYYSQIVDDYRYLVVSSDFNSIPLIHTIYVDVSVLENQVAQLFSQSMIMLIITFLALSAGGHLLISHVQRPIREFLDDVGPFANYDFDKPFRKVELPEIAGITEKMEEIRSKLSHYKRINVEQVILQEHRNRLLMTYATEMVAQYDDKGKFIFLNDQFINFLNEIGIQSNNVSIDHLLKNKHVIIRDKKSEITTRDHLIVNSQKIEIELTAEIEKVYYLQLHLNDITDHNENHLGGLLLINDQTKSREVERMRTEMINLIVHELQNPVSAGLGLTSYLLEDIQIPESEKKEVLTMIKLSMDKLTSMIDRFLAISRLESINVRIDKMPVDLNSLLKPIVDSFKTQLSERNIHLVVNEEPIPMIMGSHDMIEDVIRNLISNAIKYGGENRTILVALWSNGDHVFFSVTDHGYGIPDEYMDKIFQKFFRIQAYSKEKGTGLGLPYVKEVIKKHNGEIKVESNPQIGTRVTVSFPISDDLG